MFPTRAMTILGGDSFRDEYSLAFDGTNEYLDCGASTDIALTTGYGSIGGWFKPVDDTNSMFIVSRGTGLTSGGNISSGVCGWSFNRYNGNDQLYFDTYYDDGDGTTTRRSISEGNLVIGEWYHFVGTREQSGSDTIHKLYLNGAQIGSDLTVPSGAGNNLNDDDHNFLIGAKNGGATPMDGNISEILFYNKVLSASEVATIYNGREPYNHKEGIASGNLQAWWRMGDGLERGSGTTIHDMSDNSNNGTMTNMEAVDFNGDTP